MMQRIVRQLGRIASVAATLLVAAAAANAAVTYVVIVDTSSVSGNSGFLDFQFNPGNASTQPATVTVSHFTGGTIVGTAQITGSVTGQLPVTVTFVNNTALNEAFQQFTYGTSFSIVLTLSGPAIDTPNGTATAGSSFGVGLYDNTQTPILTNQGQNTGFAGEVDINPDGTTTPTMFPTTSGPSVVSILPLNRPTITKTFGAASIPSNFTTSLSFTITNPAGGATLHGVSFTDTLPAGLLVATPNGLTGTCNGTAPTATAGSNTISLAGATLAPGSCTFSVNVQGAVSGQQVNTTSTVTTTEGATGDPATASITVIPSSSIPVMSPYALVAFGILLAGMGSFMARRAHA